MDITAQDNTATQPISDDQELAKALAGVLPDNPTTANQASTPGALQFEETPVTTVVNGGVPPLATITQTPPVDPVTADPSAASVGPESFDAPAADPTPATSPTESLDVIKSTALSELRPLIDHVDLPAEEKFDTYLMLIRSTDDTSLIALLIAPHSK